MTAAWSDRLSGRYRFDAEGAGQAWARLQRSIRRRSAKKSGKRPDEPFAVWLKRRIPGELQPAPGGYQPAVIMATLKLRDGNRSFARFLEPTDAAREGWRIAEGHGAFAPWALHDPQGALVCHVAFWHDRTTGRPFGVGQDRSGARWWITPANAAEESPRLWTLKRQAPRLVAIDPPQTSADRRQEAQAALQAFQAAGRTVTKLAAQEAPQPRHRGKGLRRWKKVGG